MQVAQQLGCSLPSAAGRYRQLKTLRLLSEVKDSGLSPKESLHASAGVKRSAPTYHAIGGANKRFGNSERFYKTTESGSPRETGSSGDSETMIAYFSTEGEESE
jgi:hypothetical protein